MYSVQEGPELIWNLTVFWGSVQGQLHIQRSKTSYFL